MCTRRVYLRSSLITLLAAISLLLPSMILAQSVIPVIPAGTEVVVRTSEVIDSQNVDLNKEYVAVLDEPLIVGRQLAPKGAEAVLRVAQVRQAGAVKGRESLTLQLAAVTVEGNRIPVVTEGVKSESGSQGARTAKSAAGGAAVGAILGGIFGGAQGAAQGAAIGAGAGVGAAVVAGQRIQVPAETRLTFVLQQATSVVPKPQ
jgi:hypothetical protein